MSIDHRSASRAEARRRARLAARGGISEAETTEPEPEPTTERGRFLSRLFPPAPALPGRPDPLAGYSGGGPGRIVTERLFLLRRNPLAWIVPGIISSVGYLTSFGGDSVIGLVGTFVLFGSLIAAGWFGWQRPALFGVTAALLGFVIAVAFVLVAFAQRGAGLDTFGTEQVIGQVVQLLYMGALGFLGGWYGGYLRRRQTQLSASQAPRNRRR
ncbi:MAG: hypothetical protein LC798_11545 [Chloroflexi bacterium]|nr:hypothetical protein [Chloroflexota bacterium]